MTAGCVGRIWFFFAKEDAQSALRSTRANRDRDLLKGLR